MRVGIDARLLSVPVMGIGRYTAEMVHALKRQEAELFLYTPNSPIETGWAGAHSQVRAAACRNRISRMLWSQSFLPYWAAQDQVDVFWGTTHRIPRFLSMRIARVLTIHDLVWKHAGETMRPLSRAVEQRLMPQAIRLADRIIADSRSTAADIEAEFPLARGRVRVVHLGSSSLPAPQPREALRGLGIEKPYVLFVGTLEPRKNLARLLAAYARLPEGLRGRFQLVVAGGKGWGGVELLSLSAELGLTGDICVTGFVTDAQLATLYAHARLLAMPSLYEGFGLPLIEAMSFGVPVLTSNTSSMPEVAGEAAVLVDPLKVSSITDGLMRMLTDDVLQSSASVRAREQASRYSWDKAAAEVTAVCREAVAVRRQMLGLG